MARTPDPDRRARVLADATDYVLAHGLAGLSLRPLAAALGTSTRMLLYDFGDKQQLVAATLAEARRRLAELFTQHIEGASRTETLSAMWTWLTAPEQQPYLQLFFEIHIDAMAHPERYPDGGRGLITDWLGFFTSTNRDQPVDQTTATLMIATVRGLLLDRFLTHDHERTHQALEHLAALLAD
ncbi:TetR family transcriptional regulator [Amycolatopsis taiwanensis]|uniref:TetR family transcriptional regulator n=1 Tax=Amycolatopsis taiwanensis TaxID=342230 RepID=UPI00048389D9|nr:TetR family transcriptional regulator [Amycolatopsis taiwanensis]